MRDLSDEYAHQNVYNFDDSVLYYSRAPATAIPHAPVAGITLNKQRLTVGVAANADGGGKLPIHFVQSAHCPRCFRGRESDDIRIAYVSSGLCWITRDLFSQWLTALNEKMKSEGRNILLPSRACVCATWQRAFQQRQVIPPSPNATAVLHLWPPESLPR